VLPDFTRKERNKRREGREDELLTSCVVVAWPTRAKLWIKRCEQHSHMCTLVLSTTAYKLGASGLCCMLSRCIGRVQRFVDTTSWVLYDGVVLECDGMLPDQLEHPR
jgi:hypothetical protein